MAFLNNTFINSDYLEKLFQGELPVVRNVRVVGMVANVGLLFYTTIVNDASYAVDNSASIQCVLDNVSSFWLASGNSLSTILVLAFLVVSYVEAINQLYNVNKDTGPFQNWLHTYCCEMETGPKLNDEEFERWYMTEVWHSRQRPGSEARRDYLWRSATIIDEGEKDLLRHRLFLCWAILNDYSESFLSELPGILMNVSYGVTQVIMSRNNKPPIQGSENTVDFGQIVPLFLLALPCLAALEVYMEGHSGKSHFARSHWLFAYKFLGTIRKQRV
jgi:hypothetical protein